MLSQAMQDCLKEELQLHDGCHEIPLCLYLTVVAACYITDTAFDEEIWERARVFLLDEIMQSCILKGALEVAGMTEEGEMTFQVTERGKQQLEEKSSIRRADQQDGKEER